MTFTAAPMVDTSGHEPTERTPAMYSGIGGPGTFDVVTSLARAALAITGTGTSQEASARGLASVSAGSSR